MKKLYSFIRNAVSFVLCAAALSAGIFAAPADRFTDVKKGSWYYDAVNYAVENGIFSGVSKDSFDPNGSMTRAMFVCTLSKAMGIDTSVYTDVSFDDIKADDWYASSVEWAYRNGITGGVGNNCFGPNEAVSRQQLVTFLYKAAKAYAYDVNIYEGFKYDRAQDKADVSDWANDAISWALENQIISGTGNKGTYPVISPKGTATRAQAAVILQRFREVCDKSNPYINELTINSNPISNYKIVYSAEIDTKKSKIDDAAKLLSEYIEITTGIKLEVVTDKTPKSDFEILIGKTNREDGSINVKREREEIESFEISVQGNTLIIAGKSDGNNQNGTLFGVYGFAQEYLGYSFYSENITKITRQRNVNIEDGYFFTDAPGFEYRVVYWGSIVSQSLRTGEPFSVLGKAHNIGILTETGGDADKNPCLSDEKNIETAIANVRKGLAQKPEANAYWISQNDSEIYCKCEKCMKVYREEGSRAGTLIRFCNAVAEAIKDDYPNVDIWTLAYHYTTIPTKTKPADNIVVYYCTLDNCASHTYNDPNCSLNLSILNNITEWGNIAKKVYIWDYSANFTYSQCTFPIISSLRENMQWFYNNGVRGEFNNALDSKVGEFSALKANLLAKLQWNPNMSEDEYDSEINAFLSEYYGGGWNNLRKFIDKTEEISDKGHFSYYPVPYAVIANEDMLENLDYFTSLWDAAEAGADTKEQLKRIQTSRISFEYMALNAMYDRDYTNGDSLSRQLYQDRAAKFYKEIESSGLRWSERGTISFDSSKPPYQW